MSEHAEEYRELTAKADRHDRSAIAAHHELGLLFIKYGESFTDIARAIDRSVTYVSDHVLIAKNIPSADMLDRVLAERDDIPSWTVLVDWVREGGPGQDTDDDPDARELSRRKRGSRETGGMQLAVPAAIVKALADEGCNAREVMTLFWQNVSPMLLITIAYPERRNSHAA